MKKKIIIILISIFIFSAFKSAYADKDCFEFGVVEMEPFAYRDKNGELQGLALDYFSALCNELGVKYNIEVYPVQRLLTLLQRGELDMTLLPRGYAEEVQLVVGDQELSRVNIGLFYGKDSGLDPSQLNQSRLIAVRNFGYSGVLAKLTERFKGLKVITSSSLEASFKMLDYRRGDTVLSYKAYVVNSAVDDSKLAFHSLYKVSVYPYFSKHFLASLSPDDYKRLWTVNSKLAQKEFESNKIETYSVNQKI